MSSLLSILLAFVGVMLVMALAAQSLQELVKASFAFKSQTTMRALRGLIVEATRAHNGIDGTGEDILRAVVERLRSLGQAGLRSTALRLDSLNAEQLRQLIAAVRPDHVVGLKTLDAPVAVAQLDRIAKQAHEWFALGMSPVHDRYRRRMRALSLLCSAVVVYALNADAFSIWEQARNDPAFRARVEQAVAASDSLAPRIARLELQLRDSSQAALAAGVADSLAALHQEQMKISAKAMGVDGGFFSSKERKYRYKDVTWWIGMLFSTLLVSLGAPFWHDALESLFGLKSRINAEANRAKTGKVP